MKTGLCLTNVRLVSGYTFYDCEAAGTQTELVHLYIVDGRISEIIAANEDWQSGDIAVKNAKKLLMLPSFIEKHCYLDKTLMGEPWRAVNPGKNVIMPRLPNKLN